MTLQFPNTPTDGQVYTDTNSGNRWVWDSANTVWKSTSTFTQTITVSSSQPGSPVVGQLWWNQDYGRLFIYYNDGTSNQWVDATLSPDISGIYDVANTAVATVSLVFNTSNAAYTIANSAYNVTNTVYTVANVAFNKANTALQNTSGTFAGNLVIVGNSNPSVDNSYNLGSPSSRWANIYTGDAHFSNEGSSGNIVDGTTGNWTLQEGENDIFMINNKTNKIFKIKLEEV